MELRKIRKEEYVDCVLLSRQAFPFEYRKSPEEALEEDKKRPEHFGSIHFDQQIVTVDDDGRLMSNVLPLREKVYFDGHKVGMVGIGNVATRPEYRKNRCIRKTFEYLLEEFYNEGQCLSFLYPFSFDYYRKFGYEACVKEILYTLYLDILPAYPYKGTFVYVDRPEQLKDIRQVYDTMAKSVNMSMVRDRPVFYHGIYNKENIQKGQHTYLYYDGQGEPQAYFTYRFRNEDGALTLDSDVYYGTPESLFAMMAFWKYNFAGQYEFIKFRLPASLDITALLPEYSRRSEGSEMSLVMKGMVRVVNVEEILMKAAYRGCGQLSIWVEDRQIHANNGVFTVFFADGKAERIKKDRETPPDITMGIDQFSRLICGGLRTASIPLLPDVRVSCGEEILAKVFYEKTTGIFDHF